MMTQHIMLKMLDGTKQIIVRGKNKRSPVKKKKKLKKKNDDDHFLLPYQDEVLRDGAWNDIKEELGRFLIILIFFKFCKRHGHRLDSI